MILFIIASNSIEAQDTLAYKDLVYRLYDMEYLATPPEKGEKAGSFSKIPGKPIIISLI